MGLHTEDYKLKIVENKQETFGSFVALYTCYNVKKRGGGGGGRLGGEKREMRKET